MSGQQQLVSQGWKWVSRDGRGFAYPRKYTNFFKFKLSNGGEFSAWGGIEQKTVNSHREARDQDLTVGDLVLRVCLAMYP